MEKYNYEKTTRAQVYNEKKSMKSCHGVRICKIKSCSGSLIREIFVNVEFG